jgi:hypothetical protein
LAEKFVWRRFIAVVTPVPQRLGHIALQPGLVAGPPPGPLLVDGHVGPWIEAEPLETGVRSPPRAAVCVSVPEVGERTVNVSHAAGHPSMEAAFA